MTSVVPAGFDAYARVLHPAEEPGWVSDRLVRWAEVAAWSGMSLRRDAQFHSIALPPARPDREAPWSSQGPREGSLYLPDAQALATILRKWTTTPERCWFCVGVGDWSATMLVPLGEPSVPVPDPIPAAVRRGPRVRLADHDYLLYAGPVEAVLRASHEPKSIGLGNLGAPGGRRRHPIRESHGDLDRAPGS